MESLNKNNNIISNNLLYFLRIFAHDINNTNQVIQGYSELFIKKYGDDLDKLQKDILTKISFQTIKNIHIVSNVQIIKEIESCEKKYLNIYKSNIRAQEYISDIYRNSKLEYNNLIDETIECQVTEEFDSILLNIYYLLLSENYEKKCVINISSSSISKNKILITISLLNQQFKESILNTDFDSTDYDTLKNIDIKCFLLYYYFKIIDSKISFTNDNDSKNVNIELLKND